MEIDETKDEQFKELMESANEALKWAREKAEEFLLYANELEERANRYRKLAATMVIEARSYADETADLLMAEFPFDQDQPKEEENDISV